MTDAHAVHPSVVHPFGDPSRPRRLLKVACWLGAIALLLVVLDLAGVDVSGWLSSLWDTITDIPAGYIVGGLALQTVQTTLTALGWYGILHAAYPEGGVRYRQVGEGRVSSGPMHYLRDGLGSRWLAWLYALVAGVAALTTTPFTQPNSVAIVMNAQLGVPTWLSGSVLAVLTWLVIIGGITVIGRAMEKLAPLKVLLSG